MYNFLIKSIFHICQTVEYENKNVINLRITVVAHFAWLKLSIYRKFATLIST